LRISPYHHSTALVAVALVPQYRFSPKPFSLDHASLRTDIEPLSDAPFEAEATLLGLPDLQAGWCRCTASHWTRAGELVKNGNDDFTLILPLEGAIVRSQRGREVDATAGDAVGILLGEPACIQSRQHEVMHVIVPRAALSPLVTDVEQASTRLIARGNEALRLLRGYLRTLFETPGIADAALGRLVVAHVQDLVALAIGATRDGRAFALERGVKAARLHAIKVDFAANPALTLAAIATRQKVTPRYVQMLFEAEGTTFTAYALSWRLANARRLLASPSHVHWTISAIALESGFSDLSYFNRTFRRRYGATPSDVRAEALRAGEPS
jgi:AraC-like DNA-binding protein